MADAEPSNDEPVAETDLSNVTVGLVADAIEHCDSNVDEVVDDDDEDSGTGDAWHEMNKDGDGAEVSDCCVQFVDRTLVVALEETGGAGKVVLSTPQPGFPADDDDEDFDGESDLTTSCLDSTLFVPLVRLIFIFRPLSTEETCATLLLLIFRVKDGTNSKKCRGMTQGHLH